MLILFNTYVKIVILKKEGECVMHSFTSHIQSIYCSVIHKVNKTSMAAVALWDIQ